MLPGLPAGLSSPPFLSISPAALSSVLDTPFPSTGPFNFRKMIPYAKAVIADYDYPFNKNDNNDKAIPFSSRHMFSTVTPITSLGFNVAVQSLLGELFPTVAGHAPHPSQLGRPAGPNQIWFTVGRFGRFTMPDE